MDQEFAKEIELLINEFYVKVVETLLDSTNYSNHANTANAKSYINFIEVGLEKSYGRIVHIHTFLSADLHLMTDRIYPFCHLKNPAKEKIKRLYFQAHWIMAGLEEYDSDAVEYLSLEPHEFAAAQVTGYTIPNG